jgi:hypothetical protein
MINQQVTHLKKKYGEYYYRNLCSSHGTQNEKHVRFEWSLKDNINL